MNTVLTVLINNGVVKTPHLLHAVYRGNRIIHKYVMVDKEISGIAPSYWKIAQDGMYGAANRTNGTASRIFSNLTYEVAVKSGTAQIFGLKKNETYNANNIAKALRDHKLMSAFAPYDNPRIAATVILENGGDNGLTVSQTMRKILDYALLHSDNCQ
jgi:penicillin-binding protein 2